MDYATRQAILHLYVKVCLCFALKFLLPRIFRHISAVGTWIKDWRATNRHKKQISRRLAVVGTDPITGLTIGVCDDECGSRVTLTNLRKREKEVFPRSCEHCYCCGRLLPGSYEKGCVIHYAPMNEERFYCPDVDYTWTELFQETIRLVGKQKEISDFFWKFTSELTEDYPWELPSALAAVILQTPDSSK